MFSANYRNIQDIDYPANMIIGTWVDVVAEQYCTDSNPYEKKFYYDIRPNGSAEVRLAAITRKNGGYLFAQAPASWRYLGKNCWKITTSSTDKFKVTESHLIDLTPSSPPDDMIVRYFNGSLYVINGKRVIVKATAENVSQLARRVRSVAPVIY